MLGGVAILMCKGRGRLYYISYYSGLLVDHSGCIGPVSLT